ncbi:MAG: tRNA (adenosine(37)-N6)-dimethylallyltransferase MiaA [Syntrophobacterales bacterium]|jgi:tRNA dimethylallyltransferase|nr:tRNA (adenosine(37)-N6)-dimethylallyltransferase MiaA [Syntrophobacterales bacterium]
MLSNNRNVIAIVGPTCTGKSALSLDMAELLGGEIINADSMQVYRHFNIGTAKPDVASFEKCGHHLIDIVDAHEEFNAAIFKERADEAIRQIKIRGNLPILVGGTGLYLRALAYGLFAAPTDKTLREELRDVYEKDPIFLYDELKRVDHAYAMRISVRDKVRVVRAVEVFRLTGKPMSELERDHGFGEARYSMLKIGLKRERDELYRRINRRVDEMFVRGWVGEVEKLLSMGLDETAKPFSGIGYREIILYIKGLIHYDDMVEEIKKHTRHYAKRQFTWFAKERDVSWFRYPEDNEDIRVKTAEFLERWN